MIQPQHTLLDSMYLTLSFFFTICCNAYLTQKPCNFLYVVMLSTCQTTQLLGNKVLVTYVAKLSC